MTLTQILARRSGLRTGEVVTLGVGLAWSLAELHRQGRVHGAVTASNVVLTPDGRPTLVGPRQRLVADAVSPATPADDVRQLVSLLRSLLMTDVPVALRVVLDEAAEADPPLDAEAVARQLLAAAPPWPLGLPAGRSQRRKRAVAAVVAPVCAVVLLLLGHSAPTAAPPTTAPTAKAQAPGPTPTAVVDRARPRPRSASEQSWRLVLARLDRHRAEAFARDDMAQLRRVYARGSPAFRRDRSALMALRAQALRARTLRWQLVDVALQRATGQRAVLDVTDRLPSYVLVDRRNRIVDSRPGRGQHAWRLTLVRERGRWVVMRIRAR